MYTFNGPRKHISNSQGMISVDFIFSMVLCVGLCVVLFSLTFTLSMAEVAQYITYSTSRAYAAGHVDQDMQDKIARDKFASLMANKVLKPLFSSTADGSWFQLSNLEIRGGGPSGQNFNSDYTYDSDERTPHVGARVTFSPKLLNMKVAFLGSTSLDGEPFGAKLTAFLIREPTFRECWDLQVKKRYNAILNLDSRYKILAGARQNEYAPLEDNGC